MELGAVASKGPPFPPLCSALHTFRGPGKHWRRRSDEDEQHLNVRHVVLHPSYNPSTFENDLGLVELSESPRLNEFVMPICLPEHPSTEGTCLS